MPLTRRDRRNRRGGDDDPKDSETETKLPEERIQMSKSKPNHRVDGRMTRIGGVARSRSKSGFGMGRRRTGEEAAAAGRRRAKKTHRRGREGSPSGTRPAGGGGGRTRSSRPRVYLFLLEVGTDWMRRPSISDRAGGLTSNEGGGERARRGRSPPEET